MATIRTLTLVAALLGTSLLEAQSTPKLDAFGDPLPPGGLLRLGSSRLRHHEVRSIHLRDGNKELVSVSESLTGIKIWDVASGKLIQELDPKGYSFRKFAFSDDGNLLATDGFRSNPNQQLPDYSVQIWDLGKRELLREIVYKDYNPNGASLKFTRDGKRLITGIRDLTIWDVATGETVASLKPMQGVAFDSLELSPDEKQLYFGRYSVYRWDFTEIAKEPQKVFDVYGFGFETLRVTPDGKHIVVAGYGGPISFWDLQTGKKVRTLSMRNRGEQVAFTPDGKSLLVDSVEQLDKTRQQDAVLLIDLESGKETGSFVGVDRGVFTVSADGKLIAGGNRTQLWIRELKTGKTIPPEDPGHAQSITALGFLGKDKLLTGSADGTVRIWDAKTGQRLQNLQHRYWVGGICASPNEKLVVGSSIRNDLCVWEAETGKLKYRLLGNGSGGGKRTVRFTPDGKKLLAYGDDGYLRVWDMHNGKLLTEHVLKYNGKDPPDEDDRMGKIISSLTAGPSVFTSDGKKFYSARRAGLHVFDVETGNEEKVIAPTDLNAIFSFDLSPDGKHYLLGGQEKQQMLKLPQGGEKFLPRNTHPIGIFDVATDTLQRTIQGQGTSARILKFSPDSKSFAVVDGNMKSIRFYDVATGNEVGTIPDLPEWISALAFDAEGKRLLVSFSDATAILFDLTTAMKKN